MECVAPWVPAWLRYGVLGCLNAPAAGSALELGEVMRTQLDVQLPEVVIVLSGALRVIKKQCEPSPVPEFATTCLNATHPQLSSFLSAHTAHVLVLVCFAKSGDVGYDQIAAAAGTWLSNRIAEPRAEGKLAGLVKKLRDVIPECEMERGIYWAHTAFVAQRASARARLALVDGGAFLSTNRAPPLSRVACAIVAGLARPTQSSTEAVSPLLASCTDLVNADVCPLSPLEARRAFKSVLKIKADVCALFARLPPRLVPFSSRVRFANEEEEEEEERDVSEPPWEPEAAMSAALFENDPTVPCVRAVLVFTFSDTWAREFKRRGWTFGADARVSLMKARSKIRPLTSDHAREMVRWCARADRASMRAAHFAAVPAKARAEMFADVLG